jgi:predicted peptidase
MSKAETRLAKKRAPGTNEGKTGLGYLLYLPPGYDEQPDKKWPVVFFLHGAGERGSNLELLKVHGLPKLLEQVQDYPFIVVAPQCPLDERWINQLEKLDNLYAEILAGYRVLTGQVYLTGMSMGGQGTWFWSTTYPERFAAIAPICGRSFPDRASRIKHLPIWVFHGAKDPVVLLEESTSMVEALQEVGADVRFTVYPDLEHDSWSVTYANPELYEWLLSHHR